MHNNSNNSNNLRCLTVNDVVCFREIAIEVPRSDFKSTTISIHLFVLISVLFISSFG